MAEQHADLDAERQVGRRVVDAHIHDVDGVGFQMIGIRLDCARIGGRREPDVRIVPGNGQPLGLIVLWYYAFS